MTTPSPVSETKLAMAGISEESRQLAVDELYPAALDIVRWNNKPSPSLVQRRLRIGYTRAKAMIEAMERDGFVSKANSAGVRQVLVRRSGSLAQEGWKVVPIRPTEKMLLRAQVQQATAGLDPTGAEELRALYASMLSAVPTLPADGEKS